MAYTPASLSLQAQLIGGKYRLWVYTTLDDFSVVDDTDYFALAYELGMRTGDTVIVIETDESPPSITFAVVVMDADGNGTATAFVQGTGNATVVNLTATGDVALGNATTDLFGAYGVTPVDQPAAAAQSAVPTTAITTAISTLVTGTFGFVTSVQGDAVVAAVNSLIARVAANTTLLNQIRTDLVELGWEKGSA